ncbi:hypothetical protein C5167_005562 [Papaver somniferum]|uniref:6-phosphogluconate dehydrogenase NADP-binding domain-containing protein n=1 Tax=Papaver somniferum TaxID=3469 RepID=A0A4Y7JCK2_PAPSO|nr:hypothetical protein C5167_005562 [Papaver somniferum]
MASITVSFVGLDELSLKLAASLITSGFHVKAFEVSEPLIVEFLKLGGVKCSNLLEAAQDTAATILLSSNADEILGEEGVLKGLHVMSQALITSSGSSEAIAKARPVLSGKVYT